MQRESQQEQPSPFGYCQCGCGQKAPLAKWNVKARGWVKGQPIKYLRGHHLVLDAKKRGQRCADRSIGNRSMLEGYVCIKTEKGKKEFEHVLMAEKALGRKLRFFGQGHPSNEVVHHVNGVKDDNRNDNFLICTHSYHVELHGRMELSADWPEFPQRVRHPNGQAVVGSTGFKGIEMIGGRYYARLRNKSNGIDKRAGSFATPYEAAVAYDEIATSVFGDKWITNKSLGLLP